MLRSWYVLGAWIVVITVSCGSASVAEAAWSQLAEMRSRRWHDTLVARRPAVSGDSAVLAASGLAEIDERGIRTQAGVRVEGYVAWMDGELVFDDATLDEVAEEISRWYDVDVHVDDPMIASRRLTGAFRRQAVDAIIRSIAAAVDVTADRIGSSWRFR